LQNKSATDSADVPATFVALIKWLCVGSSFAASVCATSPPALPGRVAVADMDRRSALQVRQLKFSVPSPP
jgi:hypothetical protein